MRRMKRGLLSRSGQYDRGIVIGALVVGALLVLGVGAGGHVLRFFDLQSFLLVVGGSFGAALINYSVEDMQYAWRAFCEVIRARDFNPSERINYIVQLAPLVKSKGPVALEGEAEYVNDPFLKMALDLVADNQPVEDVRRILETEARSAGDHASRAIMVFETLGAYAPPLGLIGTLIGLIQMLGSLGDPSAVGPAMALALVATFYGAISANLIFIPLAGKLSNRLREEALLKALTIEGIVSLIKQENSLIVEQRLQSFLPDKLAA